MNVWGIGRDPNVWKEPLKFNPERFLECNTDYKGQDFELIPFGAGRRICIGLPLAHIMLHFVLGSLIHAFNWSIPMVNKTGDFDVDMAEKFGITLQKAVPLVAVPTPRLLVNIYKTEHCMSCVYVRGASGEAWINTKDSFILYLRKTSYYKRFINGFFI